jgi:hypothetical protein
VSTTQRLFGTDRPTADRTAPVQAQEVTSATTDQADQEPGATVAPDDPTATDPAAITTPEPPADTSNEAASTTCAVAPHPPVCGGDAGNAGDAGDAGTDEYYWSDPVGEAEGLD